MRCYICDKGLESNEIVFNEQSDEYEPCPVCLNIALEAAFTGGFKPDDDIEDEMDEDAGPDHPLEAETLDTESYRSYFDHSDIFSSAPINTGDDSDDDG